MPKIGLTKRLGSDPKSALINTVVVANAFIWYICAFGFLRDTASSNGFSGTSILVMVAVNFLGLILSALIGSSLIDKFKSRMTFLKYWMLSGVALSTFFAIVNFADYASLITTSGILGIYFGLGMPTCVGYFASATQAGNRARQGGIIILLIGLGFAILSPLLQGSFLSASGLALWRLSGLILIVLLKPPEKRAESNEKVSFRSVISNKIFLLYLIPWFMFSLVNDLTMQINSNYFSNTSIFPSSFTSNYLVIELILAGISAIVCGFLADKKGRKRLALAGFALLGLGYAALGLFPNNYLFALFYVCIDGVAWGIFSMLFLFTIWGDIAQEKSSEKYYILGILPYLLSNFTRLSVGAFVASNISENTVFSFASFLLFVAILPLVYAPETLQDRIIKNIDLSSYVNKALEVVKKETTKKQKAPAKKPPKENETDRKEEPPEDEEARKLAEKYY
jgi:MFS family permease